jgi:hypothetical protein
MSTKLYNGYRIWWSWDRDRDAKRLKLREARGT